MKSKSNSKKLSDIRIKTKIIIAVSVMLITLMTASTAIITYLIYQQNKESSFSMLSHSIKVVQEDLLNKSKKIEDEINQTTNIGKLIQNIDYYLALKADNADDNSIVYVIKDIAKALHQSTQTNLIWKSMIYSTQGDLIAFLITGEESVTVGFPFKGEYQIAKLKSDEVLDLDSWKTVGSFEGVEEVKVGLAPTQAENTVFDTSGKSITLVSKAGFKIERYNESKEQDEKVDVAILTAFKKINLQDIQQFTKLTGTKTNVYIGKELSVGNLDVYQTIETGLVPETLQDWHIKMENVAFGEVDVEGKTFFQAAFPIYGNGNLLGFITALFETDLAMQNTWQIIKALCLIAVIGIVIFFPITYFLTTKISGPLERMSRVIDEVKDTGDFSNRIQVITMDEIGVTGTAYNELMETLQIAIDGIGNIMESVADGGLSNLLDGEFKGDVQKLQSSINRALEMLGNTVIQVMSLSNNVHSSSLELRNAAQNLANGNSQQAASLEEISASMAVVKQSANQNREDAETASEFTSKAINTVSSGNQKMDEMLHSMNRIHGTSLEVGKVIKVIDEIAFQTNLLALNAAVEAARAGKYGKGFAVVAEEVRNLASRSAEAAKSTSDLIENAIKQVEVGVNGANETADALEEITESVDEANTLVDKIAASSLEQQTRIEEMDKGFDLINNVVQQNSAISQETSASASVLTNQAEHLNNLMHKFSVRDQEMAAGVSTADFDIIEPEAAKMAMIGFKN